MPCEECTTRAQLLASAEALLRDKAHKYRDQPAFLLPRLLGDARHAVEQARGNVEHHAKEHQR
jgi:hypothetical protein